jgi:hypothetical protein
LGDRHAEGVEHELCGEILAHRPANDPTREDILDGGQKQESLAGLDVFDVAHPQPVGLAPAEVAIDQVRCRRAGRRRQTRARAHQRA